MKTAGAIRKLFHPASFEIDGVGRRVQPCRLPLAQQARGDNHRFLDALKRTRTSWHPEKQSARDANIITADINRNILFVIIDATAIKIAQSNSTNRTELIKIYL
jgi:hypothetical protein